MGKELTKEQVMHVANLGRLYIADEEIPKYQVQLKQIWDEIEKINNVDIDNNQIMISPNEKGSIYREDEVDIMLDLNDTLKNVPKTNGNYVSVPKVLND